MWNEPSVKKLSEIPRLNETEHIPVRDKMIHLHFFLGDSNWWVCEFDGNDQFFGFVVLNNDHRNSEWGYFSFRELKRINIRGIEVDCDTHWEIRKASEIKNIKVW